MDWFLPLTPLLLLPVVLLLRLVGCSLIADFPEPPSPEEDGFVDRDAVLCPLSGEGRSWVVEFRVHLVPPPGVEGYEVEIDLGPDATGCFRRVIQFPDAGAPTRTRGQLRYVFYACVREGLYRVTCQYAPLERPADRITVSFPVLHELDRADTWVFFDQLAAGEALEARECFTDALPVRELDAEPGVVSSPTCTGLDLAVDIQFSFYPAAEVSDFSAYVVEVELEPVEEPAEVRWIRAPDDAAAWTVTREPWLCHYYACCRAGRYQVTCRYWLAADPAAGLATERVEAELRAGRQQVIVRQPARGATNLTLVRCFDV